MGKQITPAMNSIALVNAGIIDGSRNGYRQNSKLEKIIFQVTEYSQIIDVWLWNRLANIIFDTLFNSVSICAEIYTLLVQIDVSR